jgi:hypothetical protein
MTHRYGVSDERDKEFTKVTHFLKELEVDVLSESFLRDVNDNVHYGFNLRS